MTVADSRVLVGARTSTGSFYVTMAITCAAIAFLGFLPTYFVPVAHGTFKANPIVHIHGIVFFSWTLFFILQSALPARKQVPLHRALGLAGISFVTTMTILGIMVAINQMRSAEALGMAEAGKAFAIVPLSSIAFFAVVFALAVSNVRNSERHKRLMLLATVSLLDAPIARWFMVLLAPPDAKGPPPVAADAGPALVVALLLLIPMAVDWRRRGRPHPVYVIGWLCFVALKIVQFPLSATPAWHSVAGWFLGLAG